MTDEAKSITDKWVDSKGAEYAYAFDKKRAVHGYFGVKGIPDAVLIDATGTVVWRGHPGRLGDSEVEKHLDGALGMPIWSWPKSAKSARAALLKRDFAKALAGLGKISEAEVRETLTADIKGLITSRVGVMKRALEEGNYLGAQAMAKDLKKQLAGLEQAATAAQVLVDVEAAPNSKAILKLQAAIAKVRKKDPTKKADIQKAIGALKDIKDKASDTYAYKEADQLIDMLERRKRR